MQAALGERFALHKCMRSAIFLERDGILNAERVERGQPAPPLAIEQLETNPHAVEPLLQLKAAGYLLIATTNQPMVARGILPQREMDLMHSILRRHFSLHDILVCPHDSHDFCACRKPKPGLLLEAGFKWKLDMNRSFVVSNKWQDAEAALNAGCTPVLIDSPWVGKAHREFVAPNLATLVRRLGLGQKIQPIHAALPV
jgi:D-glycero-D-manno-heptose 1,7-bisphosphate phosphatase